MALFLVVSQDVERSHNFPFHLGCERLTQETFRSALAATYLLALRSAAAGPVNVALSLVGGVGRQWEERPAVSCVFAYLTLWLIVC